MYDIDSLKLVSKKAGCFTVQDPFSRPFIIKVSISVCENLLDIEIPAFSAECPVLERTFCLFDERLGCKPILAQNFGTNFLGLSGPVFCSDSESTGEIQTIPCDRDILCISIVSFFVGTKNHCVKLKSF